VLVRPQTLIPVVPFDGRTIPYPAGAFDVVMFVDVLHHTEDPIVLLREAKRVARQAIVIKDHTKDGVLSGPTLRFMDWVGNSHHGVVLPYNYWTQNQWEQAMTDLQLAAATWNADVGLYPWPANHLFDRSLHFVAKLTHDSRALKAA
jgi:SAM-dependent methyltransferase